MRKISVYFPIVIFFISSVFLPSAHSAEIIWKGYIQNDKGGKIAVEKFRKAGKVKKIYRDTTGKVLSPDDIWSVPQSNKDKITENLKKLISLSSQNDLIPVIVFLKEIPLGEIAKAVDNKYGGPVNNINIQASSSYDNINGLDIISTKKRRDILGEIKKYAQNDISDAENYLAQNGAVVKNRLLSLNAVSAIVPVSLVDKISALPSVSKIDEDKLMKGGLFVSAPSIGVSAFWNNGFTGGVWDVAVLDSGADASHPAFSGRKFENHVDLDIASASSYFNDDKFTSDDLHGHGTAVNGVVGSLGSAANPNNLGVSYGIDTLLNLKSGFLGTDGGVWMYWSDAIDNVDWGLFSANEPADVFNHSYGTATSQDDSTLARFWDAVVDSIGASVAICAGNSGTGINKIWEPSIAYNVICTAAIDDKGTVTRTDDSITSFSSRGPTAGGRKKPDLSAPGNAIYSPNHFWETGSEFKNAYGTSFASPHIAGACALMMDAGVTSPKAIKAVLINSAEDKGVSGWDTEYGWGYVDLNKAWLERNNYLISNVLPSGNPGSFKLFRGYMQSGNRATLVWHRHQFYNPGGNYPVWYYGPNDLDMEMYRESDNTLLATSASGIDNVEQVKSTANGFDIIKIFTPDAAFSAVSSEEFALAASGGLSEVTIAPDVSAEVPSSVMPDETFIISAVITNTGNVTAHFCYETLSLPPGFSLVGGINPRNLGSMNAGAVRNASWTVRATNSAGDYNLTLSFESASYGEVITSSTIYPVTVNFIPSAIELSSFNAKQKNKKIIIRWKTSSEIDNLGFNIWRSERADSGFVTINKNLIKSKSKGISGEKYRFSDKSAKKGKIYFYKLEDIDRNSVSRFHKSDKVAVNPKYFRKNKKRKR